ncbi:MAG: acyl-CoA dehydrogenase family protein [Candidatus Eisenbacteria bacterium]|nr:acyl-CoA dehydrogenase family protein [Candidatus Eisenbacteria bacterium]
MHFGLTEEQEMIRNMARQFASDIREEAQKAEDEGVFSRELAGKLARNGFLGMCVPEEYGGQEMDFLSYLIATEEISRAAAGQGMLVGLHNSLLNFPLQHFGTEEQKRKYLVGSATGALLGCYALTEPEAGSNATNLKTIARKDGDDYVINGRKIFITNGSVADFVILFARLERNGKLTRHVSAFLIDKGTPGFSVGTVEQKMGLKSSPTAELIFEDVKVGPESLLGPEGKGLRVGVDTLHGGRIAVAASGVGMAEEAFVCARAYALEREQYGHKIADFQGIQWMLADMRTEIDMARLVTYDAGWRKQEGLPYARQASQAKLVATETATRCAGRAIQIHGGYGYMREYRMEQIYRDAKAAEIFEGTSEVQRSTIGRDVLKGD